MVDVGIIEGDVKCFEVGLNSFDMCFYLFFV